MKKQKQNGITLIALIVTIIVLLILAGISIAMLTGENGLINQAKNAKETTEQAQEKEGIELALSTARIGDNSYQELNQSNLQNAIDIQFGEGKAVVTDNGDGSFTVSFIDRKRNYHIDIENENIEEVEEGTDIYVSFYASDKTLRFASKKDILPSIDEENGDINYGNIKWKIYTSEIFKDEEGKEHRMANTPWYENRENIMHVEILDKIAPTSTMNWFVGFTKMTSIDLRNLDTSKVIDMSWMFVDCSSLTNLNLASFDTSKVTAMRSMFFRCSALTNLDLSNFDTSKVTTMQSMFNECNNLTSLDLSNFDTSKVTTMRSMFYECNNLTSLDVGSFDTSNVTTMYGMFGECSNLISLDVGNFDTSEVTTMYCLFYRCSALTSLDLSSFDTSNVTSMYAMFYECSNLISLDVGNFDTRNVTNMQAMFCFCSNLTSLDLSNFYTNNVTTMRSMFNGCSTLTSLDLSSFDTSNVTNMYCMFYTCSSLSIDCSKWNVQNVTEHAGFNTNALNIIAPTWIS